ncbi:MAG: cell envelope integrity protein TolA [Nitrosomonadales bacterium]|nr:cell envelope integrity protein TolA [Nitrosomonadales bacterium]
MTALNATLASEIPDEVKQRVRSELNDKCFNFFMDGFHPFKSGYQFFAATSWQPDGVFAIGERDSEQFCAFDVKGKLSGWEAAEKSAISSCEKSDPTGKVHCEIYAHNNDIIYVSIHEQLQAAQKLLDAGDISRTEKSLDNILTRGVAKVDQGEFHKLQHQVLSARLDAAMKLFDSGNVPSVKQELNEINGNGLSYLTESETGEFEYLSGKVSASNLTEQSKLDAIGHFHAAWTGYKNLDSAVSEGNLLMTTGDIDKNWPVIRSAYQYFLANASDEKKSQHPEAEQNLKLTEPYYLAEVAQKEAAAKEQARLDAIESEREAKEQAILAKEEAKQAKIDEANAKKEAKRQAEQDRLDAIKEKREAKRHENIRLAEEKRIAREGDGSSDDLTCKGYGAKPGTQVYINCRIQLSLKAQALANQQAAQARAEYERESEQAAQAAQARASREQQTEYNRQMLAAQQAEAERRAAAEESRRSAEAWAAFSKQLIDNSTPNTSKNYMLSIWHNHKL